MKQYHMCELTFHGKILEDAYAEIFLNAELECQNKKINISGFYAGNGIYKVRFLPEVAGLWKYRISGCIQDEGTIEITPADQGHGAVRTEGCHFCYQDGTFFHPFGTTIYALIHQENSLVAETIETLKNAPFNKIRLCVFPKHYDYNHNEPPFYAFEKKKDGSWDVNRPCFAFWDRLDEIILQLEKIGIEADLILFHPYDRWGFAVLPQKDNLIYLDYLLRRLAAMPNVWWSLANEYDLCRAKSLEQWEEIECFVAEHDPYHHLLSNHNCFKTWDYSRPDITHVSIQTKMLTRIAEWRQKYQKPVVVDECCYEGNLPHFWGSISGREMTNRFWRIVTMGGYCTHGETFLDSANDILWWAKGGKLKGESPARIAFLRNIIEELPEALEPMEAPMAGILQMNDQDLEELLKQMPPDYSFSVKSMLRLGDERKSFLASEYTYQGHCKEDVYLTFYDLRTCAKDFLNLPVDKTYRIELIDTWEMTRKVLFEQASGRTALSLPAKEGMAVLATRLVNQS